MITSRIYAMQEGFVLVDEQLAARITEGLEAAAATAATVAQDGASIDLQLELVPPHEVAEGESAGIKSRRQSSSSRRGAPSTAPIARFFDQGTLGKRRGKLKQPRKESWTVTRKASSYTAHRGNVDGKGIPAERFFAKAKAAGRAKLLEVIHRA